MQQLHRALFAHALDARNVIRGVAHQALEVDEADGVEAVFLAELLGRVARVGGLALRGLDQTHDRAAAGKLKRVAVTGEDNALVAMLVCAAADGAEQVVRLVARHFAAHDAKRVQDFLDDRQLHRQIFLHRLACRLVEIEFLMAEGLFLYIEADNDAVGLFLVLLLEQRGEKTVDRVGRRALVVREIANAEIGAVQYAVSVYHHDLHAFFPHIFEFGTGRAAAIISIIPHSEEKENPCPHRGEQGKR